MRISEQKGKLRERLMQNKDQALYSKWLATIVRDAPLDFDLEACACTTCRTPMPCCTIWSKNPGRPAVSAHRMRKRGETRGSGRRARLEGNFGILRCRRPSSMGQRANPPKPWPYTSEPICPWPLQTASGPWCAWAAICSARGFRKPRLWRPSSPSGSKIP